MQIRLTDDELERFRMAVRSMSRQSRTYVMLRDELSTQGHWKAAPRGKPTAANFGSKRYPGAPKLNSTSHRETNYRATDD